MNVLPKGVKMWAVNERLKVIKYIKCVLNIILPKCLVDVSDNQYILYYKHIISDS